MRRIASCERCRAARPGARHGERSSDRGRWLVPGRWRPDICRLDRGFTLVEMLVTLVLLSLVLLLSAQLLRSATTVFADAEGEADARGAGALQRQLRHDLQGARSSSSTPLWSSGVLRLEGHPDAEPGGAVIWWRESSRLLRDLQDAEGERHGRRVLSKSAVDFRHRQVGRLVEVELELAPTRGTAGELQRLVVAQRNGRWRNAW